MAMELIPDPLLGRILAYACTGSLEHTDRSDCLVTQKAGPLLLSSKRFRDVVTSDHFWRHSSVSLKTSTFPHPAIAKWVTRLFVEDISSCAARPLPMDIISPPRSLEVWQPVLPQLTNLTV